MSHSNSTNNNILKYSKRRKKINWSDEETWKQRVEMEKVERYDGEVRKCLVDVLYDTWDVLYYKVYLYYFKLKQII
jgi:hypothetical protein